MLAGSSLKAALDCDWDDPAARQQALAVVLAAVGQVEQFAVSQPGGEDPRVAWVGSGAAGPRPRHHRRC
jgi:transposase